MKKLGSSNRPLHAKQHLWRLFILN